MNNQFLDSVVFSLLQHATGKTRFEAALVILWRIRHSNSTALTSAMLKVILEKMDEADEKSCFGWNVNGKCFFSVGTELLRHAVLENAKDLSKSFFIDNLHLLFRISFKVHELGVRNIREDIDEMIDEFRKLIPRITHALQIEKESGQRRDRDGNPSTME